MELNKYRKFIFNVVYFLLAIMVIFYLHDIITNCNTLSQIQLNSENLMQSINTHTNNISGFNPKPNTQINLNQTLGGIIYRNNMDMFNIIFALFIMLVMYIDELKKEIGTKR